MVDGSLVEGVYAGLRGPRCDFAEVALLRAAGADLVGMSTALEAIRRATWALSWSACS